MNDDMALVREYTARHSEEAFATLVSRHVGLVHSAAMRQVRDPHLAGEITQTVFIILARKAGALDSNTILPGWLYRTANYVSAAALKIQHRRERREQEAYMQAMTRETQPDSVWEELSPLLDDAMAQLRAADRDVLVLRFFQNKSFKEVGDAFGVEERAAQKRVARALEKLRILFAKQEVTWTAAALAGAISANSVQAVPATLAQSVTVAALAKGATAGTSTLTLIKGALKLMAWTKAKTAIVSAAVVGMATFSAIQYRAQVKLRGQNETLRRQVEQMSQVAAENANLSNLLAQANSSEALARDQLHAEGQELIRLRAAGRPAPSTSTTPAAPDKTPPAVNPAGVELPKSSWANAGFATPQAALQTRGWAVLSGDRDLFKQSLFMTDDARKAAEDALVQMAEASTDPNKAQLVQQVLDNKFGVEEGILMPMMAANQNNAFTGYKILSQQSPSADQMILEVETETATAPAQTETLNFERLGGDWKIVINKETMQKMMKP